MQKYNFLFMDEKQEFTSAAGGAPCITVPENSSMRAAWGGSVTHQGVARRLKGEAIPAQGKLQAC